MKKKKKSRGKGSMAKKKRSYRRYGGGFKTMLAPIAGGAGDVLAAKYIPINGVGSTIAGMFLKDNVTMKIGLNKVGQSLGAMFLGGGPSNNGGFL